MKKYVIAIAMMLTLALCAGAASQNHRHTPRTEQADTGKDNQDAIEAFSDTTSVDSTDTAEDEYVTYHHSVDISEEDAKVLKEVFEGIGEVVGPFTLMGIVAIVVLFLLMPLLIIIAIFYFVNRNRRERLRLAEMAIKNGQPIPDQILNGKPEEVDKNEYQSGIRQMFLGIGLAIFLGLTAGDVGFGIGALVFFIGLGKWVIARQSRNHDFNNTNNHSNIQNYE